MPRQPIPLGKNADPFLKLLLLLQLDPDDPTDVLELKSLEEAFELLDNPARRKEYDQNHSSSGAHGTSSSSGQDKNQSQQSTDPQKVAASVKEQVRLRGILFSCIVAICSLCLAVASVAA